MIHLNYFENIPMAKGQQNKFDDFGDKNGQGALFYTIKKNNSSILLWYKLPSVHENQYIYSRST